MKTLLALGLGSALLFSSAAPMAQDTKASTAADKSASVQPMMGQMDEHMKKMQAMHERMMSAPTAAERQKMMDESRQEMQDGMAMMKPMMMQGGGMMAQPGGMMSQPGPAPDGNAQGPMLNKRMDMMQMMMQTMIDQQAMMAAGADKMQKRGDKNARHLHPRDGK